MPKGLTFLPSLALAAMLALPVSAEQAPTADTVVARVNGEEIKLGHLIAARVSLPQQYQQLPDDVLYDALLEQLIQQVVLKQAFKGELPPRVTLSLENEERSLIAGEVIEKVMAEAADDTAIRAAYDAKYGDGFGGEEFNASHILVETKEEAEAIRAELEKGADFAETAKAKSTGPSGPSGGALGWFGEGRMVPEFEAAVKTLEPGQISQPVQTQFGWHVIKLNDKRKAKAPELDQVRGELASELQRAAVERKVAELRAAAQVETPEVEGLDPALISKLDLLEN